MGFVITRNRFPAAMAAMPRLVEQAVEKTAFDILRDAQQRAPIRTGHLRGSGYARSAGQFTWQVGFTAAYHVFVELGTRHMRARPHLIPAWVAGRYRLMQALRRIDLLAG